MGLGTCDGKDITSVRFFIAVVVVEWYNDNPVEVVVMIGLIDSAAMTVETVCTEVVVCMRSE